MNRFAVNICDLSELTRPPGSQFIVQLMMENFVSQPETAITDPRQMDSGAAVLNGPAAKDEERLKAFIELLQTIIGPKKLGRPIRCYEETAPNHWEAILQKEKRHA